MRRTRMFIGIALSAVGFDLFAADVFMAKLEVGSTDRPKVVEFIQDDASQIMDGIEITRYPQFIAEHDEKLDGVWIEELRSNNRNALLQEIKRRQARIELSISDSDTADEVVTLVNSGPSANRIDLVFMGDGYTASERQKFFDDMQRLIDDMFRGNTFGSYLPVFNVHAVFRASEESGIGKNDIPKKTAYKLARQGVTLRAIFPGDLAAIRSSCRAAPGCDYPIVIANDPYYGGLGGEVAISTSSPTSGTVVLRHELGHNFGRVGEEYDGGGYFGANFTSSFDNPSWKHWLTMGIKEQPTIARLIDWPWKKLTEGKFEDSWTSDGKWNAWQMEYSASGAAQSDDLEIKINEAQVDFISTGSPDRDFYLVHNGEGGFENGDHRIAFAANSAAKDPWLSNIAIYEFGENYDFDPDAISTYPLYSGSLSKMGYRSNHRTCLMRNMKSTIFCRVCQENNWLQFFGKISILDDIVSESTGKNTRVSLRLPPLGQFRSGPAIAGEKISIQWFRNSIEQTQFRDKAEIEIIGATSGESWEVKLAFETTEVRKDSNGRLKAARKFNLAQVD
jgi:hypothetical protein